MRDTPPGSGGVLPVSVVTLTGSDCSNDTHYGPPASCESLASCRVGNTHGTHQEGTPRQSEEPDPEPQSCQNLGDGDEVTVELDDGSVRISTRAEAMRRAQEYVSALTDGTDRSLADELIAERRAKSEGE